MVIPNFATTLCHKICQYNLAVILRTLPGASLPYFVLLRTLHGPTKLNLLQCSGPPYSDNIEVANSYFNCFIYVKTILSLCTKVVQMAAQTLLPLSVLKQAGQKILLY